MNWGRLAPGFAGPRPLEAPVERLAGGGGGAGVCLGSVYANILRPWGEEAKILLISSPSAQMPPWAVRALWVALHHLARYHLRNNYIVS